MKGLKVPFNRHANPLGTSRRRKGLKQPFQRRFALNGMFGTALRLSIKRRMASAS